MSVWDDLGETAQVAPMMLRGGVSDRQEAAGPYSGNAGMTNQGHTWVDYEAPKPNKRQQAIKDARINNMVFGQGYDPQYAEGRIPAQQNAEALMRLQQTTGDMRYQQPIPMDNYAPTGRQNDRLFGQAEANRAQALRDRQAMQQAQMEQSRRNYYAAERQRLTGVTKPGDVVGEMQPYYYQRVAKYGRWAGIHDWHYADKDGK